MDDTPALSEDDYRIGPVLEAVAPPEVFARGHIINTQAGDTEHAWWMEACIWGGEKG